MNLSKCSYGKCRQMVAGFFVCLLGFINYIGGTGKIVSASSLGFD